MSTEPEVRQDGFRHSGPEVAGPSGHDGSPEVAPRVAVEHGPEVAIDESVETFIGRLTELGATIDEVEAVRAAWDQPWDGETFSKRDLLHMSDAQLSALIEAGRREYVEGTLTEDEQAVTEHKLAVAAAYDDATHQVSVGSVAEVLEWATTPARAEAASQAEQAQTEHPARVTLLRSLASMYGVAFEG